MCNEPVAEPGRDTSGGACTALGAEPGRYGVKMLGGRGMDVSSSSATKLWRSMVRPSSICAPASGSGSETVERFVARYIGEGSSWWMEEASTPR